MQLIDTPSMNRSDSNQPQPTFPRKQRIARVKLGLLIGLVIVIGVITIGVVALNNRNQSTAPVPLPPIATLEQGGEQRATIDSYALKQFAEHHQLPEIPDLTSKAAEDIHNALTVFAAHPSKAESWGQLGRVFQSHQYPIKALACYTQAAAHDPADHQWAYYMGRIHADRFEIDQAIEAYERAATLEQDYPSTFLALGNLYLQQGNPQKANASFRRFATLRPQSSHGYLGLGQIAFDAQNFETAIELLKKSIAHAPEDFRAHNLLGQAYQQLGQTGKARQHLAIVNRLNRRDELSKQIVYNDPLYQKMLESNNTDAALTDRMQAAKATDQIQLAVELAEELCRRDPNDAVRQHNLALAFKKGKQFPQALACVERAVQLDTELIPAQITKAQLLLIHRKNGEALNLLEQIVTTDPDSFDGHYNRGAALVLSKQYKAAVESFEQAVRLQEDSARAHVALGEALSQVGRKKDANEAYRRALELDPLNSRARQRLTPTH